MCLTYEGYTVRDVLNPGSLKATLDVTDASPCGNSDHVRISEAPPVPENQNLRNISEELRHEADSLLRLRGPPRANEIRCADQGIVRGRPHHATDASIRTNGPITKHPS